MKTLLLVSFSICVSISGQSQATETFHDFTVNNIYDEPVNLADFAGKKLLVVNTASYCAYTPQFEDLETLDALYEDYNFEVIGFPCNDFGDQDPGTNEDILEFCEETYGVTFPMMAKVFIHEGDTAEVYKWLQLESRNGVDDANVTWNFHKFCIDEYGHWVMHFPQQTNPLHSAITDWIMSETPAPVIEVKSTPALSIRNNPANDFFAVSLKNIQAGTGNISIYSMDGRRIDQVYAGNLVGNAEYRYDVSSLPGGIYFVKCVVGEMELTERLVVVK